MNKNLLRTTAIATALALFFVSAAFGAREVVRVGNLYLTDNGAISPSRLPKHGKAPITAHIKSEIGTLDGSHPPAVRSIEFDVEKSIDIDAVGLPVCKPAAIESRDTAGAKSACREAIVGSGSAGVEVAFPEQPPFSSTGPMVLFNGGTRGGTTTVLIHTYVNVPAPTAIVVKAAVTHIHRGRFGLHIEADVPRIAGGAGSVTGFEMKIGRRFTYKGEKKSFLLAGCPTGSWATKGNVRFADGTRLGLTHVFACTPTG
jgi:hypothetical protein